MLYHHEKANEKQFVNFHMIVMHYLLLNKHKHQVFGLYFADTKFLHNNMIASSFRNKISHKADKVAELAEKVYTEYFDLDFTDVFSSSVQDLATSAASKELNA